eukprot:2150321-Amphidinium_carterae.1
MSSSAFVSISMKAAFVLTGSAAVDDILWLTANKWRLAAQIFYTGEYHRAFTLVLFSRSPCISSMHGCLDILVREGHLQALESLNKPCWHDYACCSTPEEHTLRRAQPLQEAPFCTLTCNATNCDQRATVPLN